MAVQAQQPPGGAPIRQAQVSFLSEHSLSLGLSCIPYIGYIWSCFAQYHLGKQIVEVREPRLLIEIINLKNQYKVASAIGFLLIVASKVAELSSDFLGRFISVGDFRCLCFLLGVRELYQIYRNKQTMHQLQAHGLQDCIVIR